MRTNFVFLDYENRVTMALVLTFSLYFNYYQSIKYFNSQSFFFFDGKYSNFIEEETNYNLSSLHACSIKLGHSSSQAT